VFREQHEEEVSQSHYDEAYLDAISHEEEIFAEEEEDANLRLQELRAKSTAAEETGAEARHRMAECRLESRRQQLLLERTRLHTIEEDLELEIRQCELRSELRTPPPPPPPPPRRRSRSRPPAHLPQRQDRQWQQDGWEGPLQPEPKRRHGPRGGRTNPNVWWHTQLNRARADGWEAEFRKRFPKPDAER